jgi:hypothetical protein
MLYNDKKFIGVMMSLLIVFGLIFILAFVNLQKHKSLFGILGLPPDYENWIIIILSISSIIRIIFEMVRR